MTMATMLGTSLEARIPLPRPDADRLGLAHSSERRPVSGHLMRAMLVARTRFVTRLDAWIASIPASPRPPESISPTRARLR
jgi:hypothetical protein